MLAGDAKARLGACWEGDRARRPPPKSMTPTCISLSLTDTPPITHPNHNMSDPSCTPATSGPILTRSEPTSPTAPVAVATKSTEQGSPTTRAASKRTLDEPPKSEPAKTEPAKPQSTKREIEKAVVWSKSAEWCASVVVSALKRFGATVDALGEIEWHEKNVSNESPDHSLR